MYERIFWGETTSGKSSCCELDHIRGVSLALGTACVVMKWMKSVYFL